MNINDNWREVFITYHELKDLEESLSENDVDLLAQTRDQIFNLLDSYDATEGNKFLLNNIKNEI